MNCRVTETRTGPLLFEKQKSECFYSFLYGVYHCQVFLPVIIKLVQGTKGRQEKVQDSE